MVADDLRTHQAHGRLRPSGHRDRGHLATDRDAAFTPASAVMTPWRPCAGSRRPSGHRQRPPAAAARGRAHAAARSTGPAATGTACARPCCPGVINRDEWGYPVVDDGAAAGQPVRRR